MQLNVNVHEYTVTQDDAGNLKVLRQGEPWRNCTGDGLICALAHEVERLRDELDALKNPSFQMGQSNPVIPAAPK